MQIKPYSKNAKKHSKDQIEQIAKSITSFGFNQPVVVDKRGVIIVGHGRYEAAKFLGMEDKEIPVKIVELNAKQAAAYRLADNKLNESEWDMGLVIDELKELDPHVAELTGFNLDKITSKFTKSLQKKSTSRGKIMHTCPSCGHEFSASDEK